MIASNDDINTTELASPLIITGTATNAVGKTITVTANNINYQSTIDSSDNWSVTIPTNDMASWPGALVITASVTKTSGTYSTTRNITVLNDPTILTSSQLTNGFLFNDSSNITRDSKTGTNFLTNGNGGITFNSSVRKRGLGAANFNYFNYLYTSSVISNYTSITAELWLYVDSYVSNDFQLLCMNDSTTVPVPGSFDIYSDKVDFYIPVSRSTSSLYRQVRFAYPKIPVQTWTHLVFSQYRYSGTVNVGNIYNDYRVFYNGVKLTSGASVISNPSLSATLSNSTTQTPILLWNRSNSSLIVDNFGIYRDNTGSGTFAYPYAANFNPETDSKMLI